VHKAPALAGSGKGSDHMGSMYTVISCKFLQEAVPRLKKRGEF
jgi:hypothetical protein